MGCDAPPTVELELPWPPSVNHYWKVWQGRPRLSKVGREYRDHAKAMRDPTFQPFLGPVAVDVCLAPPDRRRRDLDNSLKGVLDAVGHAGIYEDDSQIEQLRVWWSRFDEPGEGAVLVKVWELP